MDIGIIIGLIIGFVGVLTGYILDEGVISKLFQPAAFAIVYGGSIGATIITFPISELSKIPTALKIAFTNKKHDDVETINQILGLAEKARRDGLLSLEQDTQNVENAVIRKGLELVVDGIEAETIKDILIRDNQLHENIYETSAKIFEQIGGYSPTMGVLGTVMGMISILGSMEENPGGLGGKIATAFIATMYGVGTANLVWLPIAGRIKAKAERERMLNDIIIEGILSLQAGENPRIIKEKLNLSFLEKVNKKANVDENMSEEAEG